MVASSFRTLARVVTVTTFALLLLVNAQAFLDQPVNAQVAEPLPDPGLGDVDPVPLRCWYVPIGTTFDGKIIFHCRFVQDPPARCTPHSHSVIAGITP